MAPTASLPSLAFLPAVRFVRNLIDAMIVAGRSAWPGLATGVCIYLQYLVSIIER